LRNPEAVGLLNKNGLGNAREEVNSEIRKSKKFYIKRTFEFKEYSRKRRDI